jgi:ribosomal protein S18 acetylase RimI-like enzyme
VTQAIIRLQPDDVARYRAIRLEALTNHPEAFVSAPENFAKRSDEELRRTLSELTIFGAETASGDLAGIVAFLRNEGLKERHRGWMIQVYVRAEHRGNGVGRMLVEHLIEHARHHVLQVHLGVWSENLPAIRLYERLGFEIYGTEPRYLFVNGRFIDEHLMVRFLDEADS